MVRDATGGSSFSSCGQHVREHAGWRTPHASRDHHHRGRAPGRRARGEEAVGPPGVVALPPLFDRCPPQAVRLSLSGATEQVHDAERGRGSFRRVLLAVALMTSRRIPTALSIVIDRRDRHQLREAADLAEGLGCHRLHVILPQPVPESVARDSDLPPDEWMAVRHEVDAITAEPGRRTVVALDYGAPFDGPESPCETFLLQRIYVDSAGGCARAASSPNTAATMRKSSPISITNRWPTRTGSMSRD